MIFLDANVVLRYLIQDDVAMAEKAEEYILSDGAFVTSEVIAEVVYVLKKVYLIERDKISQQLIKFVNFVKVSEPEVIIFALETFGKTNLDFVDSILFAYHKLLGFGIATFDKQLIKLMSRADNGEDFNASRNNLH